MAATTQSAYAGVGGAGQDLDPSEPPSFFVRALYDFESSDASSLSFRKGAVIEVLTQLESGWWDGLMDNDVRGWFPSNYVEPISDEEAELELAAQAAAQDQFARAGASPAGSTASAFAGLGLGGGFDSLHTLIKGEGLGASDAFGQLAEAAMLDPRRGMFGLGESVDGGSSGGDQSRRFSRTGGAAPPLNLDVRNSTISMSSFGTTDASSRFDSPVHSDLTSPQTRSQSNSVSEADRSKERIGGSASTSAAERERLRAMSLSTTSDPRQGGYPASLGVSPLGRPRAATGLQAGQADLGNGSAPYSTLQRHQQQLQKGDGELWVPKVTDRGEVVYLNTRTQAISQEAPTTKTSRSSLEDVDGARPPSSAMMRPTGSWQGSSAQSRRSGTNSANMSSRPSSSNATSNSRPSSVNSNHTAVLMGGGGSGARSSRPPARNAVEFLPNPRDVPAPWKLRLTDDERHFFFCHKLTREVRYELPTDSERRPTRSRASSSISLHDEVLDPAMMDGRTSSMGGADSDDSDLDGAVASKLPGKSPRGRIRLSQSSAAAKDNDQWGLASIAHDPIFAATAKPPPPTLVEDGKAALEAQRQLGPGQPTQVAVLVRKAHEAIRSMAAIACEQMGTDGLSDADRGGPIVSDDGLYLPRLATAAVSVVAAIREVLYAAGSLALLSADAQTLSGLLVLDASGRRAGKRPAGAALLGPTDFAEVVRALQGRTSSDAKLLRLAGASTADQVASIPAFMYPIGRKINATISKLVLSSRQVIDHTVTLSSSPTSRKESTMTELDAETFEKIYQCRQRLREDALELNRLLQSFGDEAERARASALFTSSGRGWLRRIEGGVEGRSGLGGAGATTLGGGMAAGWQGNGFALPTAYETAALRTEAQGKFNNPFELKKDFHNALVRGRAALVRRPTSPLSQSLLPALQSQQDALKEDLDALRTSLEAPGSQDSSSKRAEAALLRCGTLLALVEDVDVASSVDVDGLTAKEIQGSAINQRIASRADQARTLVRRLGLLKQATYDASSDLLVAIQEASSAADALEQAARASRATDVLSRLSSALVKTLSDLAQVAEDQLKDAAPHLGARAIVYELDGDQELARQPVTSAADGAIDGAAMPAATGGGGRSFSVPTVATSGADDDPASETEVMFLGPGIAVPNGPRSRNRSPAGAIGSSGSVPPAAPSTGTSSSSGAVLSSSRGGTLGSIVNRQRSTSVTTGGSTRSMQSLQETTRSLLSRRGTLADSHTPTSIDEGDEGRNSGQRARRMLGDDAPLSAQSTHESEASSINSSLRRREEELPWYLEPDYDPNDILMGADGQVKGATLEALIARVTNHNSFDTSFNNTFLMTYRSFTTTEELLELLFARYRIAPPDGLTEDELGVWTEKKQKPIRLRVFNLLKSWLEGYFYEGEDDRHLDRVRRFALEEMSQSPSMKAPSHQLVRLVERRQGEGEQMIRKMVLPTSAPPPILPKNLKKLKLLEIDPLEMARQLTLIESRLYNQVKPAECLGLKWTKPGNEVHAKGIMESINTHNRISAWVAEAILRQEDLKKRSTLIKHFIGIADRCRALNNFSGMWAIVSALSTAPIHRLRRTWDAVSQKHVMIFESLETLMSASRNWANYRELIHKLNPPCVPFLGRYLGDLTFIEDGNRDRLKDDVRLINFGKRQKTAEVIREITIHQSTPYNLTPVPAIQKFIDDNLVESRTADELYEQSLALEPREREDEKIARLLQESGFL
ncbi:uncharacterized protein PFL1_01863 [Pseudozyma flocculosa PF-1]|uniref:Related to Guanyl nucleotide exchange factor Sql2 n=1 Tax=Pseudozyma flocculosa TaxID=84751 RepID=A0A5C3F0H0_9BASI|nr:uncharacterized protein PFL1_01863 [Pseudozyma flocculosa PF-1]EPQ30337.1 hypothetical protein PFL1_01863 [Pseudozyma flocculosa PF-1]SPO37406.1 related to Guanyl nucleotide exchange factor Sql2 [Pseudozyma flocculosa]